MTSKNAGGAIFIKEGNNLKITNNEISQTKSEEAYGGAIHLQGNSPTITNNKFTQNTAINGGALSIATNKA